MNLHKRKEFTRLGVQLIALFFIWFGQTKFFIIKLYEVLSKFASKERKIWNF